MRRKNKLKVTASSGNVFRDLGFPVEEAEHLLIRADLLIQVQRTIGARRLKQETMASSIMVSPLDSPLGLTFVLESVCSMMGSNI